MKALLIIFICLLAGQSLAQGKFYGGNAGNHYATLKINITTVLYSTERNSLSVFPNPAITTLHFSSPLLRDYELVDTNGKRILKVKKGTSSIKIDRLRNGIYLLTNREETFKILKQ